jgi:hypothetical protein
VFEANIRADILHQLFEAVPREGVTSACKRFGVSRQTYYKWQPRYVALGDAGLDPRSRAPNRRANTLPSETIDAIRDVALDNPALGCDGLAQILKGRGLKVSGVTIQGHLNQWGMGSIAQRHLALEDTVHHGQGRHLDQVAAAKYNPCLRSAGELWASYPGQILIQGWIHLKRKWASAWSGVVVIDAYSRYAFLASQDFLFDFDHLPQLDKALQFFGERQLKVQTIIREIDAIPRSFFRSKGLPDPGRYDGFAYADPPDLQDGIAVEMCSLPFGNENGYLLRLRQEMLGDLYPKHLDLDLVGDRIGEGQIFDWQEDYNRKANHGFPNYGAAPIERIENYLQGRIGNRPAY